MARSGYIAQRPPADLNLKKGDAIYPVNVRDCFSQKYSEDKQNRKESILILTSDAVTNRCTNYKSFYLFYSEHNQLEKLEAAKAA